MKRLWCFLIPLSFILTGCMDGGILYDDEIQHKEDMWTEYDRGYEDGQVSVVDSPSDFDLYSYEQVVEMVQDSPGDFDLYSYDGAVELVTEYPNDYDLYDEDDLREAYDRGRDEMLEEILDNPEDFDLTWLD